VTPKSDQALLAALESLARDPERARAIGASGREFVSINHEWRLIAQELETTLLTLCGQGRAAARDVLASA
jgi:D-inositol-3-phosphate glycosyltransferase